MATNGLTCTIIKAIDPMRIHGADIATDAPCAAEAGTRLHGQQASA